MAKVECLTRGAWLEVRVKAGPQNVTLLLQAGSKVLLATGVTLTVSQPGKTRTGFHVTLCSGTEKREVVVDDRRTRNLSVRDGESTDPRYVVWEAIRQIYPHYQLVISLEEGTPLGIAGAREEARNYVNASVHEVGDSGTIFYPRSKKPNVVSTQCGTKAVPYAEEVIIAWPGVSAEVLASMMLRWMVSYRDGELAICLSPAESMVIVDALRSREAAQAWVQGHAAELAPLFTNDVVLFRAQAAGEHKDIVGVAHTLLRQWGPGLLMDHVDARMRSFLACFAMPEEWANDGRSWRVRLAALDRVADGIVTYLHRYCELTIVCRGEQRTLWCRRPGIDAQDLCLFDSAKCREGEDETAWPEVDYEAPGTLLSGRTWRELGFIGPNNVLDRLIALGVTTERAVDHCESGVVTAERWLGSSGGAVLKELVYNWRGEPIGLDKCDCYVTSKDPRYYVEWLFRRHEGRRLVDCLRILSGQERVIGGIIEVLAVLDGTPAALLSGDRLLLPLTDGEARELVLIVRDNLDNRYVVGTTLTRQGESVTRQPSGKPGSYELKYLGRPTCSPFAEKPMRSFMYAMKV